MDRGLLDEYAPPDVRQTWASLAATVEERKAELVDLINGLQAAYATQAVASGKLSHRLDDEWTDKLDDGLREASGFERLTSAVEEAGLWPAVEARTETPEERGLYEQYLAERGEVVGLAAD